MKYIQWRLHRYLRGFILLCLLSSCVRHPVPQPKQTPTLTPAPTPEQEINITVTPAPDAAQTPKDLLELEYQGYPYITVNDNFPYFTDEERKQTESFETYAELDSLGRCGVTYANLCEELMPTEPRGEIGMVKPSGWHTIRYEWVDGQYLFNRCHLIGFQLSGENANTSNLITGTRYLNIQGMLPFENEAADYIRETGNHVLYRVTPVFNDEELVARGVLMEAYSVEDNGAGICWNVFCFNAQPGVRIDYATGDSWADESVKEAEQGSGTTSTGATTEPPYTDTISKDYVLNTRSKKFHLPTCSSVENIADHNRKGYTGSREDLIDQGYSPCGACHP